MELDDFRHHVQPGLPERVSAFLPLEEEKEKESVCSALFAFFIIEPVWVILDNWAELGVLTNPRECDKAAERNKDEGLSVLDGCCCSHSNQSALERCRVLLIREYNAIR